MIVTRVLPAVLVVCLLVGLGAVSAGADERSPYAGVEHQAYGDFAYRTTNLYLTSYDYHAVSGWAESRWILGTWENARARVRPYVKTTLAASEHSLPWENTAVVGAGIEYRPWVNDKGLERPGLSWIKSLRAYVEYVSLSSLKEKTTSPTEDLRVGIDLWRERGLDPRREYANGTYEFAPQWAELYGNLAYQKTNLFMRDYRSLVFTTSVRAGARAPRLRGDLSLMPYAMAQVDAAERPFFWQNRLLLGTGVRIMPFQHSSSPYLNKTKLYVEYLRVADYLKDKPAAGTVPKDDFRVGVAFTLNRK